MSASNKGFWNLLFEFSFSRFISLKVIGVLYAIGILVGGLAAVGIMIAGFSNGGIIIAGFSNGSTGVFSLILVPFALLFYLIILRIVLEGFAAILRIAENTSYLVELAKRNNM